MAGRRHGGPRQRRRGQGAGAVRKEAPRLRRGKVMAAAAAAAARAAELLPRRTGLAALQEDAQRRQRAFERRAAEGAEPAEPRPRGDASLRRYARELRKVVAASDVVLEVLDARDPQGCRSRRLEAAVSRAGPRKRLVLVLNKIDLVSRDVVAKWLKFLRAEFPTVAFKACTQQQSRNLKQSPGAAVTAPEEVLAGAGCVGADVLLRVLANYSRSQDVKTAITVGVVGFPNVGKSSLINSLKRSRACRVGAEPGVTKCLQAVQLDRRLRLLDCPGVVAGGPGAALRGGSSGDPVGPAAAILRRLRPEQVPCGSSTAWSPARSRGGCWRCWPGSRAACARAASPTPTPPPPPSCATGAAGRSPITRCRPRRPRPPPCWAPASWPRWRPPSTWRPWSAATPRPWRRCRTPPPASAWRPARRRRRRRTEGTGTPPWRTAAATMSCSWRRSPWS